MHEIRSFDKDIVPLEGEPVFVFRAKDLLSTQVLDFYVELCSRNGGVPSHLDGIRKARHAFEDWQVNNPEHVGMPN